MVDIVNNAAIVGFKNNMQLLLQPMGGDIRDCVIEWDFAGEGESVDVEDLFGAVDTQPIRNRHEPIIPLDGNQDRIWIFKQQPEYFDRLVNKQDQLIAGVSLQGGYVMQGTAAIRRYWVRQFINGFLGPRRTGKGGAVSVPFPAGQIIAANTGYSAGGSNHMSIYKLLAARELLALGNVDFKTIQAYIMLTPKQITDLLLEVQVTSKDFASAYFPVIEGTGSMISLKSLAGFQIIEVNLNDPLYSARAPTISGGNRINPFWVKNGVGLGFWEEIFTNISIRNDLHFEAQVYARSCAAVTRIQDGMSGYVLNNEA
jgi:hypothetical protein